MRFAGLAEAAFFALLVTLFAAAYLIPVFRMKARPKILGDGSGALSYDALSLRSIAIAALVMAAFAVYGMFTHPDQSQRVWAFFLAVGMGAGGGYLWAVAEKPVVTWGPDGIARLKNNYEPAASIAWDEIKSVEDFRGSNFPTAVSNGSGTKISWAGCVGATYLVDELRKRRPDLLAGHSTTTSSL